MSDQFSDVVQQFFQHYHDRGMMKWAGFYLSDHTQQLEKVSRTQQYQPPKLPQLSLDELSQQALAAFNQHLPVIIQVNAINVDATEIEEFKGSITGFTEQGLFLGNQLFALTDLHHLRLQPRDPD